MEKPKIKLRLEDIQVDSFVTSMIVNPNTVKGGLTDHGICVTGFMGDCGGGGSEAIALDCGGGTGGVGGATGPIDSCNTNCVNVSKCCPGSNPPTCMYTNCNPCQSVVQTMCPGETPCL